MAVARSQTFWTSCLLLMIGVTGWCAFGGAFLRARNAEQHARDLEERSAEIEEWSRKLAAEQAGVVKLLEDEVRRLKARVQERDQQSGAPPQAP